MKSLVSCAKCGKKPTTKPNNERANWEGSKVQEADPSGLNLRPERGRSRSPTSDVPRAKTPTGNGTRSKSPTADKKGTIFDRLTDTSKYTGAHKARFDKDGKGLGLDGRESVAKGNGHAPPTASIAKELKVNTSASSITSSAKSPSSSKSSSSKSPTNNKKAPSPSTSKSPTASKKGPSIFDKLTDTSLYTGAHKARFDKNGKGKGASGRRSTDKVSDLSQLVGSK